VRIRVRDGTAVGACTRDCTPQSDRRVTVCLCPLYAHPFAHSRRRWERPRPCAHACVYMHTNVRSSRRRWNARSAKRTRRRDAVAPTGARRRRSRLLTLWRWKTRAKASPCSSRSPGGPIFYATRRVVTQHTRKPPSTPFSCVLSATRPRLVLRFVA
jgi:hypothetical protein